MHAQCSVSPKLTFFCAPHLFLCSIQPWQVGRLSAMGITSDMKEWSAMLKSPSLTLVRLCSSISGCSFLPLLQARKQSTLRSQENGSVGVFLLMYVLSHSFFLFFLGNQDSSIDTGALIVPTDLNTGMFNIMYLAGTRIFSNSWGTSNRNYDTQARQVDQFMWNHQDALVLFSAGNSGESGARTINSPSTNKNGVSVGASLNDHDSWLAYELEKEDYYGIDAVAGFSSQGPTTVRIFVFFCFFVAFCSLGGEKCIRLGKHIFFINLHSLFQHSFCYNSQPTSFPSPFHRFS